MNWKKLIVDFLCGIFGEDLRPWLDGLFGTPSIPDVAPDGIILVGDAPDVVHDKYQKWIMDRITAMLSGNKVLYAIVKRWLPSMVQNLINNTWDYFFAPQIAAGTVPQFAACGFAPKTFAAAPATTVEIANLRAEAGIAA